MTTTIPTSAAMPLASAEESGSTYDGVAQLLREIEAEQKRLRSDPPTPETFGVWVRKTLLSFVREQTQYQLEHAKQIDELFDEVFGQDGDGTRFSPEDIDAFRNTVDYAVSAATLSLEQGKPSDEQRATLEKLLADAKRCQKVMEEFVADEDEPAADDTDSN